LCDAAAVVTGCDASLGGHRTILQRLAFTSRRIDPVHVNGARAIVVTSAMPKDHPGLFARTRWESR